MPKDSVGVGALVLLSLFAIGLAIYVGIGSRHDAIADMREEAVRMGHAKWIGEGTGSMLFEWLPECAGAIEE